ncbi:MAG: hypothetical protein WD116_03190 [Chloroflexota bacterium]
MTIYESLEEIRAYVRDRNWAGLEADFRASGNLGSQIAAVQAGRYSNQLTAAVRLCEGRAESLDAGAVYWEVDLDNAWSSNFFICRGYRPESANDDDWAADYVDSIDGPAMAEFAAIYDPGFDRTPEAAEVTLHLIARTLAAFGKAATKEWDSAIPLCAGYHDQHGVYRVAGRVV